MAASSPIIERVIKARLRRRAAELNRPGIVWAATYQIADVQPKPNENATPEDFAEAEAIILGTIAEGPRRYKTPNEFWAAFANYPPVAQQAALGWALRLLLRQMAIGDPQAFDEVFSQAVKEVQAIDNDAYLAMQANGQLDFDPTEIVGE